mmetsp:Transcript_54656/g.125869  ORF Transcript_54656/g.125869 Transcript_54656/m.125869 type:complete len:343 (+) Transcript_54656:554-1582(+)
MGLLFIRLELGPQPHLLEHALHLGLARRLISRVVRFEHLSLLRRTILQANVNQPRALVVADVRPDLADDFWVPVAVKEVVLHLEIGAHQDADVARLRIERLVSDARKAHREGDGQIESVKGSLVHDDVGVHLKRESVEIHLVRLGCREVKELADGRLQRHLMEELKKRHVEVVAAEVTLQDAIDVRLQKDAVVDRIELHVRLLVPAWLAAACLRCVHDVISNKEIRLQPLDAPTDGGSVEVFERSDGPFDRSHRLNHCHAAVELALGNVVLNHAAHVRDGLLRQLGRRRAHLLDQLRRQLIKHGHEVDARVSCHRRDTLLELGLLASLVAEVNSIYCGSASS